MINGVIIVHSHLNTGGHAHSEQSFETIFFLSEILSYGDFQPLYVPMPRTFVRWVLVVPPRVGAVLATPHGTLSLRAPPVLA